MVAFVKKHRSVAAYEAEAVGAAVERLLVEPGSRLPGITVLPKGVCPLTKSGELNEKAPDASNRIEVDPSLIQNTLELTLEELNYVVNPRLLLLSEEQPVGVSSLAVLQTLLNAPEGNTLTDVCKSMNAASTNRGTVDAHIRRMTEHGQVIRSIEAADHVLLFLPRFAPPTVDWAAPFEIGALDARHKLLSLFPEDESPQAVSSPHRLPSCATPHASPPQSLKVVHPPIAKKVRHLSGTYLASLSMLQRPRPVSMAPNQYDFWEDDKTGCVGTETVVQAQRDAGGPLEMLPSLFALRSSVPASSLLQGEADAQAYEAGTQTDDACPAISLSAEEAEAAEAASGVGDAFAVDIGLACLALSASLPALPPHAAASSPASTAPVHDPAKADAMLQLPPGERPQLRPRHSVPRALFAAALNTVGLQSQHFSLLDHNPPPFVIASTGLPGAYRSNETLLQRRDVASLEAEYAEWGQLLTRSGALNMSLTVHTGAMLQKWYPRDGPSAGELAESAIPSDWLGVDAQRHVPRVLSVPLAVRVIGWVMACPWATCDLPRGTAAQQLQWLGLQSLHHGIQSQMLLRLMRWRKKMLSRQLPDFLAPALRSKLQHPMSPADVRVGGGQQILLPVQMNKAIRKACAASDLPDAFHVYAELIRAAHAQTGTEGSDEVPEHVALAHQVLHAALLERFSGAGVDISGVPRGVDEQIAPQAAGSAVAHFQAKRQTWSLGLNSRRFISHKTLAARRSASDDLEDDEAAASPGDGGGADILQCIMAMSGGAVAASGAGAAPAEESAGPPVPEDVPSGTTLADEASSGGDSDLDDTEDESEVGDSQSEMGASSAGDSDSDNDQGLDGAKFTQHECNDRCQWLMAYCVCACSAAFGMVSRREVLQVYEVAKPVVMRALGLPLKSQKPFRVLQVVVSSRMVDGLHLMSIRAARAYTKQLEQGHKNAFKALQTPGGGALLRVHGEDSPVMRHSARQLLSAPSTRLAHTRRQALYAFTQCVLDSLQKNKLLPPQKLPWVDESVETGNISDAYGPTAGQALRSFMLIRPGAWMQQPAAKQPTAPGPQHSASRMDSDEDGSDDGVALGYALEAAAAEPGDSLPRMVCHICQSATGCLEHNHGFQLKLQGGGVVEESQWRALFMAYAADTAGSDAKQKGRGRKRNRLSTESKNAQGDEGKGKERKKAAARADRRLTVQTFADVSLGRALGAQEGAVDRPGGMARAAMLHLALACQVAADAGMHLPDLHDGFLLPSSVLRKLPVLTHSSLPSVRLQDMLPVTEARVCVRDALSSMYIGEFLHCFGIPFMQQGGALGPTEAVHARTLLEKPEDKLAAHPQLVRWILSNVDMQRSLGRLAQMGVVSSPDQPGSSFALGADCTLALHTTLESCSAWAVPPSTSAVSLAFPLCTLACIVRFWRDVQGLGYAVRAWGGYTSSKRAYAGADGPAVPLALTSHDISIQQCMEELTRLLGLNKKTVRRQRSQRPRTQPTAQQLSSRAREAKRAVILAMGDSVQDITTPFALRDDLAGLGMLRGAALDEAVHLVAQRFSTGGIAPYPTQRPIQDDDIEALVPRHSRLQLLCNRHVLSPFLTAQELDQVRQGAPGVLASSRALCISRDESEVQLKLVPLALEWPASGVGSSLPQSSSLWDLLPPEDQDALEADPDAWPVRMSELQTIEVCNKALSERWGMDFRSFRHGVLGRLAYGEFRQQLCHAPSWGMPCVAGDPEVNRRDSAVLQLMFQADSVHMHPKLCGGRQLFPVRAARSRLDSVLSPDTPLSAMFAVLEPDVSVWMRTPRLLPTPDAIRAAMLQAIWQWHVQQRKRRASKRRTARRRGSVLSPGAAAAGAEEEGDSDSDSSQDEAAALRQVQVSTLFSRVEFNTNPTLPQPFVTIPGAGSGSATVRRQTAGMDPEKLLIHYTEGMQADSVRRGSQSQSRRTMPRDAQTLANFKPLKGTLPWNKRNVQSKEEKHIQLKQHAIRTYIDSTCARIASGRTVGTAPVARQLLALYPPERRVWSTKELCCLFNPFVDWQQVVDSCSGTLAGSVKLITSGDVLQRLVRSLRAKVQAMPLESGRAADLTDTAAASALAAGAPPLPWGPFFGLEGGVAQPEGELSALLKWRAAPNVADEDAQRAALGLDMAAALSIEVRALHRKLQQLAAMGSAPAAQQALAYWGPARLRALVAAGDFAMEPSLGVAPRDSYADLASRDHFATPLQTAQQRERTHRQQLPLLQSTLQGGYFPGDAHSMFASAMQQLAALADTPVGSDAQASELQERWVLQLVYDRWKHSLFGTRDALRANAVDAALAVLGIDVGGSVIGGGAYSGLHETTAVGSCGSLVLKQQMLDLMDVQDTAEVWQRASLARAVLLCDGPLSFCPRCALRPGVGRGFAKCDCATGVLFIQCPRINKAHLASFNTPDAHLSSAVAVLGAFVAHQVHFAQNTDNTHLRLTEGFSRYFTRELAMSFAAGLDVSGPTKSGTMTYSKAKSRAAQLLGALGSVLDCAMSEVSVLDDGFIDAVRRSLASAEGAASVKRLLPQLDQMLQRLLSDLGAPGPTEDEQPRSKANLSLFLVSSLNKVQQHVTGAALQAPPSASAEDAEEEVVPHSESQLAELKPPTAAGVDALDEDVLGVRAQALAASSGQFMWHKPAGIAAGAAGSSTLALPHQHSQSSSKRGRDEEDSMEELQKDMVSWGTAELVSALWLARSAAQTGQAQADQPGAKVMTCMLDMLVSTITGRGWDAHTAAPQLLPAGAAVASGASPCDMDLQQARELVLRRAQELAQQDTELASMLVELQLVRAARGAGAGGALSLSEGAARVAVAALCVLSQPSEAAALAAAQALESNNIVTVAACALSPQAVVWPAPAVAAAAPVAAVLGSDRLRWVAQPRAWLYASGPTGSARQQPSPLAAAGGDPGAAVPHELAYPGSARCCVVALDLPEPRPVWPWVTPDGSIEHAARRTWERALMSAAMNSGSVSGAQLARALPQLPPAAVLWHAQQMEAAGCLQLHFAEGAVGGIAPMAMCGAVLQRCVATASPHAVARYIRWEYAPELLGAVAQLAAVRWRKAGPANPSQDL